MINKKNIKIIGTIVGIIAIIIIGVYSITNLKTNKLYIGESLDIDKRWINHKNDLLNNQHA